MWLTRSDFNRRENIKTKISSATCLPSVEFCLADKTSFFFIFPTNNAAVDLMKVCDKTNNAKANKN